MHPSGALSDTFAAQWEGVCSIRRLLSMEAQPPVEEVLKCGILARLVHLLATSQHPKLQFEACWAITNIASTEHTRAVVDAGAVAPLVAGMMSADAELREQSIWCVGNIAGDCARFRDLVLATPNVLNALLTNLQNPSSITLLRNATWTLSNFCRGKPSPSEEQVKAMVPALAWLLINGTDRDVVQDAAWGLSYLTDGPQATVQAVLDAPGVVARCVALMGHSEATMTVPALRVIGNFICGSDTQTQAACDAGALGALLPLLTHPRRNIKREAAWAVSNVAAGTSEQLAAVMAQPGLMDAVVSLLRKGETTDWNVRKEAAWVVSNVATVGAARHGEALLALGVVVPLADLLSSTQDHRILSVVLDAVGAMLSMSHRGAAAPHLSAKSIADKFEEAGLVDALEHLQTFVPDDVNEKVVKILQQHYPEAEGTVADAGGEEEGAYRGAGAAAGGFAWGAPSSSAAAAGSAFGSAFGSAGALSAVSSNAAPGSIVPMFGFGAQPAAAAPSCAAGAGAFPSATPQHFSFTGMSFT